MRDASKQTIACGKKERRKVKETQNRNVRKEEG
jgi:hypothetical protein